MDAEIERVKLEFEEKQKKKKEKESAKDKEKEKDKDKDKDSDEKTTEKKVDEKVQGPLSISCRLVDQIFSRRSPMSPHWARLRKNPGCLLCRKLSTNSESRRREMQRLQSATGNVSRIRISFHRSRKAFLKWTLQPCHGASTHSRAPIGTSTLAT